MKKLTIISTLLGGATIFGSSVAKAQTFGLEYTTEWQTDFNGSYEWLNLLQAKANVPVYRTLSFEAATISTAKTGDCPIVDDLLTYSNIEAGNIVLTFSRLGFGFNVGNAELFAGINNVNEDYFTSDLTSLFTNSCCGISPTISCNYDIANYPMASWCLHYRQQAGDFSVQTSLYPGQGYNRLLGHDNLFTLNLKRDGIFSISSIDYSKNGIYCVLGLALHYGVCIGDADGMPGEPTAAPSLPTASPEKKFSAAPWLLSEISLPYDLGLLAHASYSSVKEGCRGYAGLGLVYNGKRVQPGVAFNYASFTSTSEYSAELTCRIPLYSDKVDLQPALHIISTDGQSPNVAALLRLAITI